MAELIVADAGVLIVWLDDRNVLHEEGIDVLASVQHFLMHPQTVDEVLAHPARHGREDEVVAPPETIGMVASGRTLEPIRLARRRATSISRVPDCVVLSCAWAHGPTIASVGRPLVG